MPTDRSGPEARCYQPDIDIGAMAAVPRLELSSSDELPLPLRWAANLHARLKCSLAITGGVATPTDGIKATLAGAHAVQMVSAILRHGLAYFTVMRDGLMRWRESKQLSSIGDVRGRVDRRTGDASIFERANYIRTLQSWTIESIRSRDRLIRSSAAGRRAV